MDDAPVRSTCKTWTSDPLPPGRPAVAADARGLRYGDGVFVTLGIRDGVLLDAPRQLARLREAARRIGLRPPPLFDDPDDAPFVAAALLADLGAGPDTGAATARLQWHAGAAEAGTPERGRGRGFGREEVRAEAILDLAPAPRPRQPAVVVLEEADAPLPALPRLKTCSALAQVACARAARALGADEGIRARGGIVLETASANLFWLLDGELRTPSGDLPLYAGSVRERLLECARDAGLTVVEGRFRVDELDGADAVLLTNAARGVEAAVSLEGRALPEPPAVVAALREAVEALRAAAGVALP